MRSRDVVGKKIIAVHQTRSYDQLLKKPCVVTNSIELDDGTWIYLYAHDDGLDPFVITETIKREPRNASE